MSTTAADTVGTVPGDGHEDRRFWFWAIFFSLCWIVVPTIVLANFRPDVIEQLFIGPEWVFGTAKHPSLTALVLEVFYRATFRASFGPYLVSRLFVLASLVSVWLLARDILPKSLALAATLAMFNYWFFQFESTLYNNNVTLNAAWSVCVVLCWFAFKTNRTQYWLLAGAAIGVGLHFKYTLAVFPVMIVLFLLLDPAGRRYWKTPGPWLTTAVALAIFLPHLVWVVGHDYVTLQYASDLAHKPGWLGHLTEPLDFIGSQALLIVPILVPLIPICGWLGRPDHTKIGRTFLERYLLVVVAAPFLFQLILSAAKGVHIRGALGSHLWIFLTVFLVYSLRANRSPVRIERSVRLSVSIQFAMLVLTMALVPLAPYITGRGSRYHFPGKALAAETERVWHERFEKPLPWTTGEWWLAGNVSAYGRDRARVYACRGANVFMTGKPFSTWGTLDDLRNDGGMVLWRIVPENEDAQIPPTLHELFPDAVILTPIVLPWQTSAPVPPVRIGMAIIPPR